MSDSSVTRYALIDSDNRVYRVVTGEKPHHNARPIKYNEDKIKDVDRFENQIIQKPKKDWDVFNDRVEVTYDIVEKDIESFKTRLKQKVRKQRQYKRSDGVYFLDTEGNELKMRSDQITQSSLSDALFYLQMSKEMSASVQRSRIASLFTSSNNTNEDELIAWERYPGHWSYVGIEDLKLMGKAIGDHVQSCFRRQEQIEKQIDEAQSIRELHEIDINKDWPESANLYGS